MYHIKPIKVSENVIQSIPGIIFRRFLSLVIVIALALVYSCSEDSIVTPVVITELKIDTIFFPDSVWVNTDYNFIVTTTVSGNIEGNLILVIGSLRIDDLPDFDAEFLLYDDGSHFDNIPGDNEFTSRISSSIFENNSGTTLLELFGTSSANKPYAPVGASLTKSITAVNGFLNTAPILSNISAPDSVRYDLSESTLISVDITDEQGFADISFVTGLIYAPFSPVPNLSVNFQIDQTGESPYRAFAEIPHEPIRAIGPGIYTLFVKALDSKNNQSNEIITSIDFKTGQIDSPPEIVSLIVPDSIRADNSLILLQAEVFDTGGLSDIDRVFFFSVKPDGSLANNGNPFFLFDDGGTVSHGGVFSGDPVAGDGIYSVTIRIPAETEKGTFVFRFQAVDKAGLESAVLERTVVVF